MVIQSSSSRKKLKSKYYKFLPEAFAFSFMIENIMHPSSQSTSTSSEGSALQPILIRLDMKQSHLMVDASRSLGERDQNLGLK